MFIETRPSQDVDDEQAIFYTTKAGRWLCTDGYTSAGGEYDVWFPCEGLGTAMQETYPEVYAERVWPDAPQRPDMERYYGDASIAHAL